MIGVGANTFATVVITVSFYSLTCTVMLLRSLSVHKALENDLLDKKSLGMVNAYQPSLTSTWMFQKSMSVGVGEKVNANLIVDLLANNFRSMDKVIRPFRTLSPPQALIWFVRLVSCLNTNLHTRWRLMPLSSCGVGYV